MRFDAIQDEREPAREGSNRLCLVLDLYCRWPESGAVWYKAMQLKKTICLRILQYTR